VGKRALPPEMERSMTKKSKSAIENLEEVVSDVANAVSVAVTGSEIGILELAIEDELKRQPQEAKSEKKAAATIGGEKIPDPDTA
jgi:hypothetical protein